MQSQNAPSSLEGTRIAKFHCFRYSAFLIYELRGKMRIAKPCSLYSPLLLPRVELHESTACSRISLWRPSNTCISDAPNRAAKFNLDAAVFKQFVRGCCRKTDAPTLLRESRGLLMAANRFTGYCHSTSLRARPPTCEFRSSETPSRD
jgi:hypothetical protein